MGLIYQPLTGGSVAAGGSLDVLLWPAGPVIDLAAGILKWQLSVTGSVLFQAIIQGRLDPSLSWLDLGGVTGTSSSGRLLGGIESLYPEVNLNIRNFDPANILTGVTVWVAVGRGD